LTCSDCDLNYPRKDASLHTENKCINEQLRQLRQNFAIYKQQQDQKINGLTDELNQTKTKVAQHDTQIISSTQRLDRLAAIQGK
jgi:ABC-type transporter Mla subunit MlaD